MHFVLNLKRNGSPQPLTPNPLVYKEETGEKLILRQAPLVRIAATRCQ